MKRRPGIAKFRHRLALCSQQDVVTENGTLLLARETVRHVRAMIDPKKASTFSAQGATHKESRDARTHVIKTRYHTDLNVSTYAWLHEARLKSSPRWFKILSVVETEDGGQRLFVFDCRLVERADDIPEPDQQPDKSGPVVDMPEGVTL